MVARPLNQVHVTNILHTARIGIMLVSSRTAFFSVDSVVMVAHIGRSQSESSIWVPWDQENKRNHEILLFSYIQDGGI